MWFVVFVDLSAGTFLPFYCDNRPGSDAKRIADDDSASSAAIRGGDGQLNARQMDSGRYLVNLA